MPPQAPLAPFPWIDLAIVVALVFLNGLFAMSELAIVSSRKARLEALARSGGPGKARGARAAIALGADPGKFLSTVQIGITGIAVLAGAFSGDRLGAPIGARLARIGVPADIAEQSGFAVAILLTTYVSLIIGELVPKQIALRNPEPIAAAAALPMLALARATAPLGWLLDGTSALIFRLIGLNRETESHVTAEELHLIVAEASSAGVIEESERAIISGVVRLADRPVREVMTPRTEVEWLDLDAEPEALVERLAAMPHSRMPVARGSVDQIVGVVQARDVVGALLAGAPLDLLSLVREAPVVPDQMDAMDALETLRDAAVPMALVHDEYGHFEGLVSPADLLAAIAGSFVSDREEGEDAPLVAREDGSWLIAGSADAAAMAEKLCLRLPEDRDYATAAGFVLAALRRLPHEGETFVAHGWKFEIVDMDGRRIDKLLACELPKGAVE